MYVTDNNHYPLFSTPTGSGVYLWPDLLTPLLTERVMGQEESQRQTSAFLCPSVRGPGFKMISEHIAYGYSDQGYAFQGLGAKLVPNGTGWEAVPVPESEVNHPSETIALGDSIARQSDGLLQSAGLALRRWQLYQVPSTSRGELQVGDRFVRALHRNRANVGFCDGHVESNTLRVLFDDTTDEALRRWNRDHEPHRDWLIR